MRRVGLGLGVLCNFQEPSLFLLFLQEADIWVALMGLIKLRGSVVLSTALLLRLHTQTGRVKSTLTLEQRFFAFEVELNSF